MIAAASSGSGKTTLSLGLMRALCRRGHRVQPFKCGPDYIDTWFHRLATGRDSVNLDLYMSSPEHIRNLATRYGADADICVAEGVMGLFDGFSRREGSSADVAKRLGLPVILLVNAASTSYSVAATIYGFSRFDTDMNIVGVIFNRVASPTHYASLRDACADAGMECLGYLRRDNTLTVPSRHLGLSMGEVEDIEDFINRAADAVEEGVDVDRLLSITAGVSFSSIVNPYPAQEAVSRSACRVAVARDSAFSFIYRANIDSLRDAGCAVTEFSPLADSRLPDADFVYLPGGYPELYAGRLSENESMRRSIAEYVERGGRLWAECGGLIYLCQDIDGAPMCGVFPLRCTMNDARLTLGYRTVDFGSGKSLRGHEFHYSRLLDSEAMPSVATQTGIRGKAVGTAVYRRNNALASYTHLYWAADPVQLLGLY